MRDERLLAEGGEVAEYSAKEACDWSGGSGEREREVERELWPERVDLVPIWIVLESRRDEIP